MAEGKHHQHRKEVGKLLVERKSVHSETIRWVDREGRVHDGTKTVIISEKHQVKKDPDHKPRPKLQDKNTLAGHQKQEVKNVREQKKTEVKLKPKIQENKVVVAVAVAVRAGHQQKEAKHEPKKAGGKLHPHH